MFRNLFRYGFPQCEYCGGRIPPWNLMVSAMIRGDALMFSHKSCWIAVSKTLAYWQAKLEEFKRRCEN